MKSASAENSRKNRGNYAQEAASRTADTEGSLVNPERRSPVGQAGTASTVDNSSGRSSNSARGPLHATFVQPTSSHYYTKSHPNEMDSSLPSVPSHSIKRQGSSFATNSFHTAHSHQSHHSHTSSTGTTGLQWPMDDESQSTMEDGSLQDFFAMDSTLKDDSVEKSPSKRSSVRRRSSLRESLHSSLSSIRHAATGAATNDSQSSRYQPTQKRLGESMSSLPMGDSDHFAESKTNSTKRASVSWARVKNNSTIPSNQKYQQPPPPAAPQQHLLGKHDEELRRPAYQQSYAQPTVSIAATSAEILTQSSQKTNSKINMLYLVAAGLLGITLVWGAYHQCVHATDTPLTSIQQEQFLLDLLVHQAGVSPERLADIQSDAHRAVHWLVYDDPLPTPVSQKPQSLSPALLQRFSLATLYFATHPATTTTTGSSSAWKQEQNWMSDTSVCDWHGVHCELVDASDWFDTAALEGMVLLEDTTGDNTKTDTKKKQQQDTPEPVMEVVRIELSNNNMHGTVPPELQYVSQLMSLDLSHNHLTGELPQDDSLGHFRRLTNLRLEHNQLTGSLPGALGENQILKQLRLDHNSLKGSIPEHMAHNLRNLQHWSLAHNRHLTGTIPTTIAGLRNIQVLEWNDNQLTGSLPFGLSRLTTLRKFWFLEHVHIRAYLPS